MSAVNLSAITSQEVIRAVPVAGSQGSQKSFAGVLKSLEKQGGSPGVNKGGDIHRELVALQESILGGKEVTPNQLISLQIRASRFHIKVDLISKAAESFLATTRKFQSGQ